MEALDDVNVYQDIVVPVGCDLILDFTLEPWNATGWTNVNFVCGGNNYAITVTVTQEADDFLTEFLAHLTPGQLNSLGLNVAGASLPYSIRGTDTAGQVWPLGFGVVLAE